ncbi:MAG: glycosyltransferase involved in cell wall biosynthesis [Planctomycetota bacterium]|jgi:glycosyltransferase involved in cell wall biosynthesis
MATPRVTVGVPVRNGMPYLRLCLDSILAQSYEDFELLISDNASDDGSEELCREYERKDSRVRYLRQEENLGAAGNFNVLVQEARGELFKWSAADDELAPELLQDCVSALDAAGDAAVLAHTQTRWIDIEGALIEDYGAGLPFDDRTPHTRLRTLLRDPVRSHLFKCSAICGVVRRSVLQDTGLIRAFGASDKVCLVELALRGGWVEVCEPHFRRRVHEQSSLNANGDPAELARWFDPKAGEQYPAPRTTLFKGYLEAWRSAPLGLWQRLRCLGPILGLLCREWRVLAGEYKIRAKQRLSR